MKSVKTKNSITSRRPSSSASCEVLRRLARAPETASQIYELAESLYMRSSGGDGAGRMSLADIERVNLYLRQAEQDAEAMKKQFRDLAGIEGSFHPEQIPIGF
jgi:hypothetical protein